MNPGVFTHQDNLAPTSPRCWGMSLFNTARQSIHQTGTAGLNDGQYLPQRGETRFFDR
ncbi:BQ5605_C031g10907 [Microbotryum silenes-dioicae]|uniref:BQ5605_C031g10907 protein n=1 Tax=Microbotryum silenes-dioicae TaxID=796604 RepID=A0A2X0N3K9_9BASI|nr:BQ5605_C031g10907 [Microbotryum silenes-dioicae]